MRVYVCVCVCMCVCVRVRACDVISSRMFQAIVIFPWTVLFHSNSGDNLIQFRDRKSLT